MAEDKAVLKFEYRVVEPVYAAGKAIEDMESELSTLGAEGWELVSTVDVREWKKEDDRGVRILNHVLPVMVFKRAVTG